MLLPLSGEAQLGADPVRPDRERLILPLGDDGLYLALPGSVGGVYRVQQTEMPVVTTDNAADVDVKTQPSFGSFYLQPSLLWTPGGDWSLVKLSIELRGTGYLGTQSGLLNADPRRHEQRRAEALMVDQSYALTVHRHFGLLAGLVRPHYGLGLSVTVGAHQIRTRFVNHLTALRLSVIVYRLQAAWAPKPLRKRAAGTALYSAADSVSPIAISLAADLVETDDTAVRADGDVASQVALGLRMQSDNYSGALAVARRHQTHHEGGETSVTSASVHVDSTWAIKVGP